MSLFISTAKQFTACLGVGVLVFLLGYATDINFLQKKLHLVKEQGIKTSRLLQHRNKKMQISKTEPQTVTNKQWAHDFDITDIFNDLEKASTHSQVDLQMLEPQAVKEDEFFVTYPIKIEINGQYKNLLKFMNSMFNQPYFIAFEELTLQKKVGNSMSDGLNMQTLLIAYKNKMAIIKNAPSEQSCTNNIVISEPENDIFAKSTGKISLFLWASKELTFLGAIKHGKDIYGFVSDPVGTTHKVAVGDKIGLKQSKITAINEQGITTENKADSVKPNFDS